MRTVVKRDLSLLAFLGLMLWISSGFWFLFFIGVTVITVACMISDML